MYKFISLFVLLNVMFFNLSYASNQEEESTYSEIKKDVSGNNTIFVYNKNKQLIEIHSASGISSYLLYDEQGRIVEKNNSITGTTYYEYDESGNVLVNGIKKESKKKT